MPVLYDRIPTRIMDKKKGPDVSDPFHLTAEGRGGFRNPPLPGELLAPGGTGKVPVRVVVRVVVLVELLFLG